MAKPIDPTVKVILDKYKINPRDALWDCHGTPVMYHRFIEKVAAEAGISFDAPQVLEANGATKSVAIAVVGRMGERAEWSIGEAAPGNNKNAYPFAMAEKRAKDRVTLKLIGLHGFIYSEDEMQGAAPQANESTTSDFMASTKQLINFFSDPDELLAWWNSAEQKKARADYGITLDELNELKAVVVSRRDKLTQKAA